MKTISIIALEIVTLAVFIISVICLIISLV